MRNSLGFHQSFFHRYLKIIQKHELDMYDIIGLNFLMAQQLNVNKRRCVIQEM